MTLRRENYIDFWSLRELSACSLEEVSSYHLAAKSNPTLNPFLLKDQKGAQRGDPGLLSGGRAHGGLHFCGTQGWRHPLVSAIDKEVCDSQEAVLQTSHRRKWVTVRSDHSFVAWLCILNKSWYSRPHVKANFKNKQLRGNSGRENFICSLG